MRLPAMSVPLPFQEAGAVHSRINSARAKRDFANVTLLWVKNCQNTKIKLARCLILSVAGFGQTSWRPFCRETARVSTARHPVGKRRE